MTIGKFKESKKIVKKNILPPFEDKGWIPFREPLNVVKSGYEIGFSANKPYAGFHYEVPIQYAGKLLSMSVSKANGSSITRVHLGWRVGATWNDNVHEIFGIGKKEGIIIPSNADEIRFSIQNHSTPLNNNVYFKNVQLEEGSSTNFEESEGVNHGILNKKEVAGKNLIPDSSREFISPASEFMNFVDLAPIFNKYGTNRKYSLSLDLKSSNIANKDTAIIYMQNGNGTKYNFVYSSVTLTTEYQRFKFEGITPSLASATESKAMLAFYGTYGSGSSPRVKNIQLEFGVKSTGYEEYKTQANKKSKKEGLKTNGIDQYVYREAVEFDEFEIDFVKNSHKRTYDSPLSVGSQSVGHPFYWLYTSSANVLNFQVTSKIDGSLNSMSVGDLGFGERNKVRVKISDDKIETILNNEPLRTLTGNFNKVIKSNNKALSLMTYSGSGSHMLDGILYSFKAWNSGELVMSYEFENRPNHKKVSIDYSGKGNDGSIMGGAKPSMRSRMPLYKQPFKKYPFDFSRPTVEMLGNVTYGLNKPRIINDGILLEEEAINLFTNPLDFNSGSWSKEAWSGTIQGSVELAPHGFREASRIIHGSGQGYLYQKRNNIGGGTTHTISTWMKSATGLEYDCPLFIWGYNGALGSKPRALSTEKVTNEWKKFSLTYTTASDETSLSFGIIMSNVNVDILVWGSQHEQRPYVTAFTRNIRPMEKLDTPVTIDGQGGSIEVDFDFNRSNRSQYVFDSTGSRWLMYFYAGNIDVFLNGAQRMSVSAPDIVAGRHKVTVKWTVTTCELLINGVSRGTGIHNGASSATKITLGRRFSDVEFLNGTFYNFVIKDRNGLTTFKL